MYLYAPGDPQRAAERFLEANPTSSYRDFVKAWAMALPAATTAKAEEGKRAKATVTATPNSTPTKASTPTQTAARSFTPGEVFRDCADCPEMVVIPAGGFELGSSQADAQSGHAVTISRAFALGRYAITVGEFRAFVQVTGYHTDAERADRNGRMDWSVKAGAWVGSRRAWQSLGFTQGERHPAVCIPRMARKVT
jgi:formylglycine-generating enzyme required for sulfatase activity